jgi:hypothetical protein
MSSIDKEKIKSILEPQSSKIEKSVNKVLDYNLDLKENIDKIKNKVSVLSRKEINLNFIDRFSRFIYTNEKHLAKIEFIQYIIFIVILYIYNPFNINTKYPAFSKLLTLIIAFLYVILFFFIKIKVENANDVDLMDPTEKNTIVRFFAVILFFILFMMVVKGVMWILINTRIMRLFHNLMTVFIVVGILGVIYLFTKKTIDKAKNAKGKSFLKLALKFVMYLPCLLVDFIEYAKYEYHLAPKPVWLLLGLEAGLVGMVFIVPYVFDKIMNLNGEKLLSAPVNLNVETVVGHFKDVKNPNNSPLSLDQQYSNMVNEKAQEKLEQEGSKSLDNAPDKKYKYCDPNVPKNEILAWIYNQFNHGLSLKIDFSKHPQYTDSKTDRFAYRYALSGWFYINPQPPNTSRAYSVYTNILSYGKKVQIEYNGKLNSLRVMAAVPSKGNSPVKGKKLVTDMSDNTVKIDKIETDADNMSIQVYQTNDVIYQKWNNIVINYNGGELDVFLNGVLVSSITGAVPYMSFDTIIAGANNGIMGGVCNINYYKDTLSEKTIKTTYKSLRIKNFPYI